MNIKEEFEKLFNSFITKKSNQFLSDKETAYYWFSKGRENSKPKTEDKEKVSKIERWQLLVKPTEEGAWNGKISVEFDRNDLKIITDALSCAEMEGYIDTSDMDYMFNKLNIDKGW